MKADVFGLSHSLTHCILPLLPAAVQEITCRSILQSCSLPSPPSLFLLRQANTLPCGVKGCVKALLDAWASSAPHTTCLSGVEQHQERMRIKVDVQELCAVLLPLCVLAAVERNAPLTGSLSCAFCPRVCYTAGHPSAFAAWPLSCQLAGFCYF